MSRKLFEQTANNNPNTLQRLAFGRSGQASENMTLGNFILWLGNLLPFLKTTQNLNDLPSKTTSRTNLGVYSTAQVDSALSAKANIYPTSGGALRVTNTSSFTPTTDYHPATKKYVDDNSLVPMFKGYTNIGDLSTGPRDVSINLGVTLPTSSYMVVCELYDLAATENIYSVDWGTAKHAVSSFSFIAGERLGAVQNLRLYFMIYPLDDFVSCTNTQGAV